MLLVAVYAYRFLKYVLFFVTQKRDETYIDLIEGESTFRSIPPQE